MPATDNPFPVAHSAAASAEVLFDQAALLARTDGDRAFARELLRLFVRSARATMTELAASVRSGADPAIVRKLAHTLKGSAATVSAGALSTCAANLERVAGTAHARAALSSLNAVFMLTMAELARLD
jgi:HPt (histidine-containing phosphotransfer) domain-containing protein